MPRPRIERLCADTWAVNVPTRARGQPCCAIHRSSPPPFAATTNALVSLSLRGHTQSACAFAFLGLIRLAHSVACIRPFSRFRTHSSPLFRRSAAFVLIEPLLLQQQRTGPCQPHRSHGAPQPLPALEAVSAALPIHGLGLPAHYRPDGLHPGGRTYRSRADEQRCRSHLRVSQRGVSSCELCKRAGSVSAAGEPGSMAGREWVRVAGAF